MKHFSAVKSWVKKYPLEPIQVDCATTVMLKILDGKCKMKTEEKRVMTHLYHAVKHHKGELLGDAMHALIAEAESGADDAMRNRIYEKRVLAETMISRPVMKAFKAMIRQQGLFTDLDSLEEKDHRLEHV